MILIIGFKKGIMFFSGGTVQGLEPVCIMGCAFADSPFFHSVGDGICDRRVKSGTVFHRFEHFEETKATFDEQMKTLRFEYDKVLRLQKENVKVDRERTSLIEKINRFNNELESLRLEQGLVRETIDEYIGSSLLAIFEHQFFSSFLALAVFACSETSCESSLNRTGDHYRAVVTVFLESVKKN